MISLAIVWFRFFGWFSYVAPSSGREYRFVNRKLPSATRFGFLGRELEPLNFDLFSDASHVEARLVLVSVCLNWVQNFSY